MYVTDDDDDEINLCIRLSGSKERIVDSLIVQRWIRDDVVEWDSLSQKAENL